MHLQFCIVASACSIAYVLVCCHSNETCALAANLLNIAQLKDTSYHSPELYLSACSSVGMLCGTVTYSNTQKSVANTHFALATTHVKCNEYKHTALVGHFYVKLGYLLAADSLISAKCKTVVVDANCLIIHWVSSFVHPLLTPFHSPPVDSI